jgi:hypothetical protein
VGPFLIEGADEALHFPVPAWGARWDQDRACAEVGEGGQEGAAVGVGHRVVTHHRLHRPAPLLGEPARRLLQEGGAGPTALVGVQLQVGQPGVVIDAAVGVQVAGARAAVVL